MTSLNLYSYIYTEYIYVYIRGTYSINCYYTLKHQNKTVKIKVAKESPAPIGPVQILQSERILHWKTLKVV